MNKKTQKRVDGRGFEPRFDTHKKFEVNGQKARRVYFSDVTNIADRVIANKLIE